MILNKKINNSDIIIYLLGVIKKEFSLYDYTFGQKFEKELYTKKDIEAIKIEYFSRKDKKRTTYFKNIEVKDAFKRFKTYFKKINKKFGKKIYKKGLIEEGNRLFDLETDKFMEDGRKQDEEVIINSCDADLYARVVCAINLIKQYYKNSGFEKGDIRYIKTLVTKISNYICNEFEPYIFEASEKLNIIKIKLEEKNKQEKLKTKSEKINEFKKIKVKDEVENLPTTKNSATKKIINLLKDINKFEKSLSRDYGEFPEEELEKVKKDYKKYKLKDLIEEYQYLSSNFMDIKNKIGMVG